MKSKVALMVAGIVVALPGLLLAHGGGMMGGAGNGNLAGTGMLVVADDGSVLVTDMSGVMMGGGAVQPSRALVNIGPDGDQRWSVEFTDGWPMLPATHGNIVVVSLVSDWWMGSGGMGDSGWGPGGQTTQQQGADQATLWRST